MAIRVILGLGNPGRKYEKHRHNVGYRVIDRLSDSLAIRLNQTLPTAVYGRGEFNGEPIILAKPTNYMNRSGGSARQLVELETLAPENLLVVCDDTNIPLTQLRVRSSGSHGGNNGLRNIIDVLRSNQFGRVRCGVDKPAEGSMPLEDYVLEDFARDEEPLVADMVARAAEAALAVCRDGYESAMARYNNKVAD